MIEDTRPFEFHEFDTYESTIRVAAELRDRITALRAQLVATEVAYLHALMRVSACEPVSPPVLFNLSDDKRRS